MKRLQRFKLHVASSVVSQQNSGLESMESDQIMELFHLGQPTPRSSTPEARSRAMSEEILNEDETFLL